MPPNLDKLMYDGQKLIVDKGIFQTPIWRKWGAIESVSPSALGNVDIEAKGTKGTRAGV